MRITKKQKIAAGIAVLVLLVASIPVLQFVKNNKTAVLQDPLVQRFIPLYRSLYKLPDIFWMPWAAFAQSELPTYEIFITPKNIERMNEALPDQPFASNMNVGSKVWVPAYFRAPGYEGNVRVRYRGNLASHWNAYQKSYLIRFPNSNLYNGMRRMNLVIPSKRRYFAMSLNGYRAEKLGLIKPDEQYVNLNVNGAQTGVLLAFEHWSQEWIEKMPMSALSTIYGVDEGKGPIENHWSSWNSELLDRKPLEALSEIIEHAPDEEFKKLIPLLIDIEDWYAWDVMFILASGYHTDPATFGANNLVMIFDRSEGRFKPVPYNTVIYTPSFRREVGNSGIIGKPPLLHQRILSIPEFRARRDEVFREYVANNRKDDIAFVDAWRNTYTREFLMDTAKNDNHFSFLAQVRENYNAMIENFDDPYDILDHEYEFELELKDDLKLPKAFKYLEDAIRTPQEFVRSNPNFVVTSTNELLLPRGTYRFTDTVIIPRETKLTIAPGTTILMDREASFVSYSPVVARGTVRLPISVLPLTERPWGVFAVMNTAQEASSFTHTVFQEGFEATINGAYISGTLALHNADGTITNSRIEDAQGDDGLNVKGGNVTVTDVLFTNNSSDGVDLDFVHPDTIFTDNIFADNKGDAIDLSWSTIVVANNTVATCADKGISVGEQSAPTIRKNVVRDCDLGIAVKDSSQALITENQLIDNRIAISLYQKKPFFGGGHATATQNLLWNNSRETELDALSTLYYADNSTTTEPSL